MTGGGPDRSLALPALIAQSAILNLEAQRRSARGGPHSAIVFVLCSSYLYSAPFHAILFVALCLQRLWVHLALHVSPRSAVFFRNFEFIIDNSRAPRAPHPPGRPSIFMTCQVIDYDSGRGRSDVIDQSAGWQRPHCERLRTGDAPPRRIARSPAIQRDAASPRRTSHRAGGSAAGGPSVCASTPRCAELWAAGRKRGRPRPRARPACMPAGESVREMGNVGSEAGLNPCSGQIGAIHGDRGRSRLNRVGHLRTMAA